MVDVRGYTSTELCQASGLSFRQIDRWAREGDLVPSVREGARGEGRERLYSEADLRAAVAIGRSLHGWRGGGIPRWLIAEIVQAVHAGLDRAVIQLGEGAQLIVDLGGVPSEPAA